MLLYITKDKRGAKYTKSHNAEKLEIAWKSKEKSLACKLEYQIKTLTKQQKEKAGHEAVKKIFSSLTNAKEIENLIYEFDERKTPEALFAFYCDKLECDIQSKLYDEQHCVDINHQEQNSIAKTQRVNELLSKTHSFSKMWMKFGQEKYDYDKNFLAVSNYAISHSLKTIKTKEDSAEF